MIKEITTSVELASVLADNARVIVYFGAVSWCAPCRVFKPKFNEAAAKAAAIDANWVFVYIDLDKAESTLIKDYEIQSVPTVLIFEPKSVALLDTTKVRRAADILDTLGL